MSKVAIVQSNYIPWKGYFDLIARSDVFILFDEVQFTKRDWRNRNRIKSKNGLQWLSVPILTKGKYYQKINETKINRNNWAKDHFLSLQSNYSRAPFFKEIMPWLSSCYFDHVYDSLSHLNYTFIAAICNYLGVTTEIMTSSEIESRSNYYKSDRLLEICKALNASEYISGPRARSYLDVDLFCKNEINVSWMSYDNYPIYPQLWDGFDHYVSVLDLIFNCGKESTQFMKFVR